nr:uncharacterized protein LOC109156839 isoform X1 [Ipomoea trifida]
MCNKGGVQGLGESILDSERSIELQEAEDLYQMDNNSPTSGSVLNSNDETPRVKFLCSFGGSILPRPQDGKLRYVGGETRIVSVARDISYEELMAKMRELFEGATVLKYQQPDEDLDALVSVVNDDDVINMMEEYDKLGSGDGFTRLRIFLFSQLDFDGSLHFGDGDDRDNERRYVDALNSLNDSPEYRTPQHGEFPLEDITEQYFNQMSLEGSLHNQRNAEMHIPQIGLHHLNIPHSGLGQPQRYNEMDAPWSPGYYSPRQPGHEPRPVAEIPTSPSSSRYYPPYQEVQEKSYDRTPEEYSRLQVNHQSPHELLFPNGPHHVHHALEGNSIREHCQLTFQRNQPYPDSSWKPGDRPYAESNLGSGLHQVVNSCAECPPNREMIMMSTDANMHHPFYPREQTDPRALYNDTHNHERGWVMQHQSNSRVEEPRTHVSGVGRLTDHYIIDNGINIPMGHSNVADVHHVPPHYVHHDDPRNVRTGQDFGNQVFHDHAVAKGSHIHVPPVDDYGVRYGNSPYAYGADPLYQVPHGPVVSNSTWRNVHGAMHGGPSYEACGSTQVTNGSSGPAFIRGVVENSSRLQTGLEYPNSWVDLSQKKVAFDESSVPEYFRGQTRRSTQNAFNQEIQFPNTLEPSESSEKLNRLTPVDPLLRPDSAPFIDDKVVSLSMPGAKPRRPDLEVVDSNVSTGIPIELTRDVDGIESSCTIKAGDNNGSASSEKEKVPDDSLSFTPELIASVKQRAMQNVNEVKAKAQEDAHSVIGDEKATKVGIENEPDAVDVHGGSVIGSDNDNDNLENSKIELTEAEAEAIERGLQTIRNEDLEEIRELGSGTYGSVYHGKWKGSDVAIKRIKASCFAGKPSERERLIADFWKEALILSSLHHPNVVSFYGVVRDGPDGSLATVTEFMVNGSLKQFLRKKDRTIDRRKRLIIAMDTAFGMEYLHGKNIVHFDLKCENLLVNMRDPQRPVCKIGDLGLSKVKQKTLVSGGVRGTLPWMAPELLSGKCNMVTEKIDVYSFGIVMWELLTGDEPYADMHCASIIGGIVNNSLRPQIPTWCDPEWKSLMESCWASDSTERPSFSEISQKLRSMAAAMNVK